MAPKDDCRVPAKIQALLLALLLGVLAVSGACSDTNTLPARNWNRINLQQIKIPESRPFAFAVLGDNRGNPEVFSQLLRQIDQDPDIVFAIHLGDMVQDGDVAKYRFFFHNVRTNLHKPLLSVIGNHELQGANGLKLYHEIFGRDYYAFEINRHCFIAVNDAAKTGLGAEQRQWLEQELQKSRDYRTRTVYLHIPLFDPEPGKRPAGLPPAEARNFADLFKKYGVNHVFAAHKHSYYTGDWDGLPYTITGGAGAKLYGTDPQHYFFHYLKVSVAGDKIDIQVQRLQE